MINFFLIILIFNCNLLSVENIEKIIDHDRCLIKQTLISMK